MSRPREFEPSEALAKAVEVFRAKGYRGTSVEDLVAGTGVSRAGLYGTFGGKQELFASALRRYADTFRDRHLLGLHQPDAGLPELREYFQGLKSWMRHPDNGRGCLLCNTATELGAADEEVAAAIRALLDDLAELLSRALTNARESGELSPDLDPDTVARHLVATQLGLAVMVRTGVPESVIGDTLDSCLARLEGAER